MNCTECNSVTRVYFSKGAQDGVKIRHRECIKCKARFVSHETLIRMVRAKKPNHAPILDSYTSIRLVRLPEDADNDVKAQCA